MAALKRSGFLVLKTIRLNESGYPDIIAMKEGRTCWIEIKEEDDTLKPLQMKRIRELNAQGVGAICIQKNKGIIYGEKKGVPIPL
jgi:Holliday junction resolvase